MHAPADPHGRDRRFRPLAHGVLLGLVLGLGVGAGTSLLVGERRLDERDARVTELEGQVAAQGRELERLRDQAQKPTGSEGERGGLGEALSGLLGGAEAPGCLDTAASSGTERSFGSLLGGGEEPTLAEVARDVSRLRGLQFNRVPRPRYLSPKQLSKELRRELRRYPAAEAEAEARTLAALGAIPPGTNLKKLVERALGSQVAGFYDPRTKELSVVTQGGSLGELERLTLAHELEHTLADQRLAIPRIMTRAQPPEGAEDRALAASSLIEGDATLTMELYAAETLSLLGALTSLGPALAAQEDLDELPYYFQQSLVFPYEEGLEFVCALHEQGGWAAVNRAYRQPPTTSAQVLLPERYRAGERAVDGRDPSDPGRGWRLLDRTAFGAADLLWLFEAPGSEPGRALEDARERVRAWAGGKVHTWGRGRQNAVGLALVARRGSGGLCQSMRAWYSAAFPSARVAPRRPSEQVAARSGGVATVVSCAGQQVRVGIGPDLSTARAIAR